MSLDDKIRGFFGLIFLLCLLILEGQNLLVGAPAPPRRPAVIIDEAPRTQVNERRFTVDWIAEGGNSSGTAFPIGDGRVWITARHVVDRCSSILLDPERRVARYSAARSLRRVDIAALNRQSDIVALTGVQSAFGHRLAARPPRAGDRGASFGYPRGALGATDLTMIERAEILGVGTFRVHDRITVWMARRIDPGGLPTLGGISGGPIFNASGDVVGFHIISNLRRGRVFGVGLDALRRTASAVAAQHGGAPVPLPREIDRTMAADRTRPIYCRAS